jgi:hypothetical protein
MEERQPGIPVGVVLDRRHLGRNGIFLSTKIDLAITLLAAATAMARRHTAVDIASPARFL